MKFTFKSEFVGFGSPETTLTFEADQIEDVIAYFEQFLMGAGYNWLKPGEILFERLNESEGCGSCSECSGGCGR